MRSRRVGTATPPSGHLLPRTLGAVTMAIAMTTAAAPAIHATPEAPPGTMTRTAPLPTPLTALASARLLTLTSRDAHDQPRTMSASLFVPHTRWLGPGRQPLVAMAVGTYGQGDRCAPSRAFTSPVSVSATEQQVGYEISSVALLLARGYAVVVPDYLGMAQPGVHTYLNRIEQGRAVIDAARAATSVARLSGPVGFWGYSQGGAAAGAAAELQPVYAPRLALRAVYSGAPPGDVTAALRNHNIMALPILGWSANSAMATDPALRQPVSAVLNPAGRTFLRRIAQMCLPDAAIAYGTTPSSQLTADGRPLADALLAIPGFAGWARAQRLGTVAPRARVLVHSARNDDVVPFADQTRLVRAWRSLGAHVDHLVFDLPPTSPGLGMDHSWPHQVDNARALDWFAPNLTRRGD